MDLGSGIAIGTIGLGFFSTATTAIIKLGNGKMQKFDQRYVSKEVCNINHTNLVSKIDGIDKKIEKIYEHIMK